MWGVFLALWYGVPMSTGILKDMITSKEMMVTPKGVDTMSASNHMHLVFLSNEAWVVPAGEK